MSVINLHTLVSKGTPDIDKENDEHFTLMDLEYVNNCPMLNLSLAIKPSIISPNSKILRRHIEILLLLELDFLNDPSPLTKYLVCKSQSMSSHLYFSFSFSASRLIRALRVIRQDTKNRWLLRTNSRENDKKLVRNAAGDIDEDFDVFPPAMFLQFFKDKVGRETVFKLAWLYIT
jgi:hypothetical protein